MLFAQLACRNQYMNTMVNNIQLDDKTFLTQFENRTLDPAHFSHLGHLRIAWLYLSHNNTDTAVKLVCAGIKSYAESLGENTKFNLTMTDAFVRIMAKRIDNMETQDWPSFLDNNRDLVEDAISVLLEYFSKDLLFSEVARTSLVKPDTKSI